MNTQVYEDYKYVMADTSRFYLGAKYSYRELVWCEDVPFKVKTIIERYILPEVDGDTTLESHFYFMKKEEFACRTFQQLKVKVKVSRIRTKKTLFGKPKKVYVTETMSLAELCDMSKEEKERDGIIIQEIAISKLALASFAI